MKQKNFFALILIFLLLFTGAAFSKQPEDALSVRPDESVYIVVGNENLGGFLRWLLSRENLNIAASLASFDEGVVEIASSVIDNVPIESAAITLGINKTDIKTMTPFFQMAFTVRPELHGTVKKIADGNANADDIASLILGEGHPMLALAGTMLKVEREAGNTLKINNELFLKAEGDLLLLGSSLNEVRYAEEAIDNSRKSFLENFVRRFSTRNFAILHIDYGTAAEIDDDDDTEDLRAFFDHPLNIEFGFETLADKFIASAGLNLKEALKEKFARALLKEENEAIEGGNITLTGAGGTRSPLAALGTKLNFSAVKEHSETRAIWNEVLKILRRFKITEDDFTGVANGAFSLVINGSVPFEGFKIPGVYIAQTGRKGAAEALFNKLAKSQHFSQIIDNAKGDWGKIIQVDSSLSPVSCLIGTRGDTLGVALAEISSLGEVMELKPGLKDLLRKKSIGSIWIDFEGIQSWLNDDSNGVFALVTPFAILMGYGEMLAGVRDVLNAKLSVPSVALHADSQEVFFVEFDLADINPEDGILVKLADLYRKFAK